MASGALVQAGSIRIGEGPIGAILDTLHGDVVNKSVGNPGACGDACPVIGLVLDVVVVGTIVYTQFHVGVGVGEELNSC